MNPLIELYDKMLEDPETVKLMLDPAFNARAAEIALDATSEQHEEFDEYVKTNLQAQFNRLNSLGEHNE